MTTARHARTAIAAAALLSLTACMAGIRGAPPPPFDRARAEARVAANAEDAIDALLQARDGAGRDREMNRMLALVDVRYARFRHDLIAGRRHAGAVGDLLQLATHIAGPLTDSVGVKDNYLAFAALVQGGGQIYDREYMFDHTIAALVSQMDANRRGKLLEIRAAMHARSVDEYSGQLALLDILDYHQAGTLFGAIAGVQKSAAAQESAAAHGLRTLSAPTMDRIAALRAASARIDRMIDALPDERRTALRAFVSNNGVDIAPEADAPALKRAMASVYRTAYADRPEALIADLGAAGFVVPEP